LAVPTTSLHSRFTLAGCLSELTHDSSTEVGSLSEKESRGSSFLSSLPLGAAHLCLGGLELCPGRGKPHLGLVRSLLFRYSELGGEARVDFSHIFFSCSCGIAVDVGLRLLLAYCRLLEAKIDVSHLKWTQGLTKFLQGVKENATLS